MSDPSASRRTRSFGFHKSHYLPSLHRVNGAYLRSRARRRNVARNHHTSRTPSNHVLSRRESKNTPWLPGDDYLLINAVVWTWNLNEVFHTVRFAHFYTEKEIEARWRALLFDPIVSSNSLHAISKLPPTLKAQLDRQVPFSLLEDELLAQVDLPEVFPDGVPKSLTVSDLNSSVFCKLLQEHPSVFYSGRDEVDLFRQWSRFQSCRVINRSLDLNNQTVGDHESSKIAQLPSVPRKTCNPCCNDAADTQRLQDTPLGGDPESFSDTELLLKETASSALSAGLNKLSETCAMARRQHMLTQSSYHGFQALVTDSVRTALLQDSHSVGGGPVHSQLSITDNSTNHVSGGIRPLHVYSSSGLQAGTSSAHTKERSQVGLRSKTSSVTGQSPTTAYDSQRRLELYRRRRRLWARLRSSVEQAKRWTDLVEICATKGLELTDCQPIYPALAALTGSRTRFLINEKEVTFGRSSLVYKPHIDLSLEGDATRVSRCHGRIRLTRNGTFLLTNFSSHPVFVDGHPVLMNEEVELRDFATVVIAHLALRFDVNQLYVHGLCKDISEKIADTTGNNLNSSSIPDDTSSPSDRSLRTSDA